MEVHLDLEDSTMAQPDRKGKRRRPQGRTAAAPVEVAAQTGRVLAEREAEWLERLANDPASFAVVEREVHDQARHQADLYVAGLLAKASERPEMAGHVAGVTSKYCFAFLIWSSHHFTESRSRWAWKACSWADSRWVVLARIAKAAVTSEARVVRRRNSRNRTRGFLIAGASMSWTGRTIVL